jgi:hypothetical protein
MIVNNNDLKNKKKAINFVLKEIKQNIKLHSDLTSENPYYFLENLSGALDDIIEIGLREIGGSLSDRENLFILSGSLYQISQFSNIVKKSIKEARTRSFNNNHNE